MVGTTFGLTSLILLPLLGAASMGLVGAATVLTPSLLVLLMVAAVSRA